MEPTRRTPARSSLVPEDPRGRAFGPRAARGLAGAFVLAWLLGLAAGCGFLEERRRAEEARIVREFETGFRGNCLTECMAAGGAQPACSSGCDCTLTRLYGTRDHVAVVRELMRQVENGGMSPATQQQIEAHSFECAADEYDRNFVAACAEPDDTNRTQEERTSTCQCMLASFRGTMGRGEGTRWMMENLDGETPTPAGTAALERATTACTTR